MNHILIVEDDERTRHTIETFCRNTAAAEHALFYHAANGMEAYTFLERIQPDIMFLDMEMPGMNGRELLDCLMEQGRHVNVVIVSGYDSFEYTRKAIQYGSVDYLLKPVNRKQVSDVLTEFTKKDENAGGGSLPWKPEKDMVGEGGQEPLLTRQVLEQIKAYIDANYVKSISLFELSELYHYSREHISREFKKQYGMGVIKYMNDLRLERARVLLAAGASVKETCTRSGFLDDSYFSKLFKEKYGVTPGKFSK